MIIFFLITPIYISLLQISAFLIKENMTISSIGGIIQASREQFIHAMKLLKKHFPRGKLSGHLEIVCVYNM